MALSRPDIHDASTRPRRFDVRLAVLCLGVWLHAANSMLAATTLPSAVREFGGGDLIGWAFALYLLGSILAGAGTGALVRRADLRLSLALAAMLYLIGCVICATAPSMAQTLAGRLVQGFGGGFLVALAYVGLSRWFDRKSLPRLLALVSVIWSLSAFMGPSVGGAFATYADWRWAYWAFAAQAALAAAAVIILMPVEKRQAASKAPGFPAMRLSVLSLAVLSVAAAGMAVDTVLSPFLCLSGAVGMWLVLRRDANRPESRMFPGRPLDPFRLPGAGLCFVFTMSLATMSLLVYGPILLETLFGMTPLAAGYLVAGESIAWGAGALAVSRCGEAPETGLIRTGAVLIVTGIAACAFAMPFGSVWLVLIGAVTQGAGFGISWAFVVKRMSEAAHESEKDVAATSVPTMQQIGFAFGAAAAGIIANAAGFGDQVSPDAAQLASFWIFAAFLPPAAIGVFAAWRVSARPSR